MSLRKVRAELGKLRQEITARAAAQQSNAAERFANLISDYHERLKSNPGYRPRSVIEKLASPHAADVDEAIAVIEEDYGTSYASALRELAMLIKETSRTHNVKGSEQ
jgi:hypothetical protein